MRKENCILLLVFYVIRGAFVLSFSGFSCTVGEIFFTVGFRFIQWAIFPSGFSFCTVGTFFSVGFHFFTVSDCVSVDFVFGTVGEFLAIGFRFSFTVSDCFSVDFVLAQWAIFGQ
jgi:hypothetical protein